MTVERKQTEMIDAALPDVLNTVRSVLTNGKAAYRYENTIESEEGRVIDTVIRPHQSWLLSTKLCIHLYAFDTKTKVVIETKSQWFLFGDIADYYGGYIRDLFESIRLGNSQDFGTSANHDQAPGKRLGQGEQRRALEVLDDDHAQSEPGRGSLESLSPAIGEPDRILELERARYTVRGAVAHALAEHGRWLAAQPLERVPEARANDRLRSHAEREIT